MLLGIRSTLAAMALGAAALAFIGANPAQRDGIGDLLKRTADAGTQAARPKQPAPAAKVAGTEAPPAGPAASPTADPREGDPSHEQAQRLMKAIDAVLQDAAKNRGEARKLPTDSEFIIKPIWTETREDRERRIRDLLDAALGIVTDVPIVELQKKIEGLRKNIREIDDRTARLREKQLLAPKDGVLPGLLTDTVDSLGKDIEEARKRIELNREEIGKTKAEVQEALKKSGIVLAPEQVDLLLDSVLSGDLVRLVAVFNSAKLIDGQLAKMMVASGENIGAARKYFAMHAALFALLVHSQDMLIAKVDRQYLPKLTTIEADIRAARAKTAELLRAENREDQKRALESNRDAQRLADDAAKGYRRYLLQQREQVAKARQRATHDLRIADNTFETVEASFQLRNLMRDAAASFEAIQKLEAPTFDQIFKNEELRREFEGLTRKLDAPSS
jgi:polyhydroxyalkanoate synthesis regulator phasin